MKSVLFRPNRALQCVCCMFKFSTVFALANSVDPEEIPRYVAFHPGIHCLPKYLGIISILHRVNALRPYINIGQREIKIMYPNVCRIYIP